MRKCRIRKSTRPVGFVSFKDKGESASGIDDGTTHKCNLCVNMRKAAEEFAATEARDTNIYNIMVSSHFVYP